MTAIFKAAFLSVGLALDPRGPHGPATSLPQPLATLTPCLIAKAIRTGEARINHVRNGAIWGVTSEGKP